VKNLSRVVTVRIDGDMEYQLIAYAENNGLMTRSGEPNVGAAMRALARVALDGGLGGDQTIAAAVEIARSDLLQRITARSKEAYAAVLEDLEG